MRQLLVAAVLWSLTWSLIPGNLHAYSSFDEVIEVGPTWSPLPSEQLPADARDIRYRLVILGLDRVRIDLRNPSTAPVMVEMRLPGYQSVNQAPGQPTTLHVAAGATGEAVIAVTRTDRLCTESAVQFISITLGKAVIIPRPFVVAPLPVARAYAVSTTWEHAGFRAGAVAYTISVTDPETLDLRVLNRSGQPIHAELAVVGWQRPGVTLPRLHLLPGVFTEMLIPGIHVDAAAAHAAVALWAVRVGDDHGPLMGDGPEDGTRFAPLQESWHSLAFGESAIAGFNPDALVWQASDSGITLRNRAPVKLGVHLALLGGAQRLETDIQLDGLATTMLPLTGRHEGNVLATAPSVAGIAVTVGPLTVDPAPANAVAARARWPDARFNALTLITNVTGTADGGLQAQVVFSNRAAISLHAEWYVPGYQIVATNPRLHLAPGATMTVVAPLSKRDIRLGLAQPAVWDVRLGDDSGPACCIAPSP